MSSTSSGSESSFSLEHRTKPKPDPYSGVIQKNINVYGITGAENGTYVDTSHKTFHLKNNLEQLFSGIGDQY